MFKILNFNIFLGFSKNEYFGGMEILRIHFGDHFYTFYGPFLRSMYRKEILFGVAKISNNFWCMPDIPDIFCCEQQMLGPSLCMKKK